MTLQDKPITTDDELNEVLNGISMVNTVLDFKWRFEFKPVSVETVGFPPKQGWLLWVSFERPDTLTNEIGRGRGRDEVIWQGTWLSGVVKTAWLLVELMVRHELMEGFRFHNQRIFNPHNSVIDLMEVQNIHDRRMGIVESLMGSITPKPLKTIDFNIWDDYDEDEGTYGYVEEHDILTVDQKCEIAKIVFDFIQTLDMTGVKVELNDDDVNFENLSHERLEKLIKELESSNLTYNGLPFNFYSES